MAQTEDDPPVEPERPLPGRRRRGGRAAFAVAVLVVLALGLAWLLRDRIAGSLIAGQLRNFDVPATYRIESIGARRQVLRDVVVGDPAHPDLTIERVETELVPTFGAPAIGAVTLVRPRLYGRWRGGKLSFGTLDKALFGGTGKQPFRLPDMALTIVDGRALMESDFGPIGLKLEGTGPLRGGFAGELAAIAPQFDVGGCHGERASFYGSLRIAGEKPRFTGPLRLAGLACPQSRLAVGGIGVQLDATFDSTLDGVDGTAGLRAGALALGDGRSGNEAGTARFTWRKQALTARYAFTGRQVQAPQAGAVAVNVSGVLHRTNGRIELEGELGGSGIRLGEGLDATLAQAQRAAAGTLAAPLLEQVRVALLREGRDSGFVANYMLRRSGQVTNLVVPQAALRGGSGATLLSVSDFQLTANGTGVPRVAGNFATGGAGLPQVVGRLERTPGGQLVTRVTMSEYRAGEARLALPRLTLVQLADGALGFAGEAELSGALPGGSAENLLLPLEGNWSAAHGLAAWRRCMTLRFDRLALASLVVDHRAIPVCPPRGGAILAADARGVRIAAGAPSLDLAGRLGTTPIRIRGRALGLAWPGTLAARALDVELGPPATASRFRIADLAARVGKDIAGRFAGSDVRLNAVPLDILDAGGEWRYANGALTLANSSFRLEDRQADHRFQPLVARDGELRLADNRITATATLREPQSGREVVRATIHHDLGSGRGDADLAVAGITFDQRLQPDTLTRLALGVVANAKGSVRGSGRIGWTPENVTSSGSFTTDSLDFAAAFGPVKGAAGTIRFTDLLGMVTAPDQQLRIAAINPGIEVDDGVLTYELQPGLVLAVKGATWPFLDGTLRLLPFTTHMGATEVRRFTLAIAGLNAARLVERMDMGNLSATGIFDGTLSLVFDQDGGRIDGGQLKARAPGGNVSYVGALTYKDLSTLANFAFDALKSLDYREMTLTMEGPLAGEIITRVQLVGIRQGKAAKRNFLTERIARLPIRFNVNLRAPFFQMASSFRSLYDPTYVRDPRTLGLLDEQGHAIASPQPGDIQPPESEHKP